MGSQPAETVKEQPEEVVTAQEFSALVRELSNWNRWGPEDQRGALHFLTAEGVAAATGLVRDGVTVSLSLPLNTIPAIHNPVPAEHHMTAPTELDGGEEPVEFTKDYVGLDYHNDGHTHIDALCHPAYPGRLYNDRPEAAVTGHGAAVNSIEALKDGLVGRGVLLDIPRLRGRGMSSRGWSPASTCSRRISRRPSASSAWRSGRATSCWFAPAIPGVSPSSARGTRLSPRLGCIRLRCGSSRPEQSRRLGRTATAIPRRGLPRGSTSRFTRSPSP